MGLFKNLLVKSVTSQRDLLCFEICVHLGIWYLLVFQKSLKMFFEKSKFFPEICLGGWKKTFIQ